MDVKHHQQKPFPATLSWERKLQHASCLWTRSFINRDTETTQERGSAVLRLTHSSPERADFTDVTHVLPLTFEKQGSCALNQDHKTKSQTEFKGMERRDPSMLLAGDHRLKPAYTRADRFFRLSGLANKASNHLHLVDSFLILLDSLEENNKISR